MGLWADFKKWRATRPKAPARMRRLLKAGYIFSGYQIVITTLHVWKPALIDVKSLLFYEVALFPTLPWLTKEFSFKVSAKEVSGSITPLEVDEPLIDATGSAEKAASEVPQVPVPSIQPAEIPSTITALHFSNELAADINATKQAAEASAQLEAQTDPNLVLVQLRIEIERALRKLAGTDHHVARRSPNAILSDLAAEGILPQDLAGSLRDLISLGNRAAHGEKVDPAAAASARLYGPRLIQSLNALTKTTSRLERLVENRAREAGLSVVAEPARGRFDLVVDHRLYIEVLGNSSRQTLVNRLEQFQRAFGAMKEAQPDSKLLFVINLSQSASLWNAILHRTTDYQSTFVVAFIDDKFVGTEEARKVAPWLVDEVYGQNAGTEQSQ